ncbi:MAG: hypothetical protein PHY48_11530 [Candidatus Cloacimonetes bacterium]|nr:hypothetical protein [Candidatus Cloacimonadota bacterium]
MDKHRCPEDVSFRHMMKPLSPKEVLLILTKELGVEADELTQRRRNSPLRAIGASFLIKYAGLTQREVADFLNAGSGSAISRQLSRYRKLLAETKKWEDLLMRCETRLKEKKTEL